jgi:protease I
MVRLPAILEVLNPTGAKSRCEPAQLQLPHQVGTRSLWMRSSNTGASHQPEGRHKRKRVSLSPQQQSALIPCRPCGRPAHNPFLQGLELEKLDMAQPTLKGLRVAILATDGFEQSELLEPRKALDAAGATTEVVAPMNGDIRGWNHKEWGESVHVTQAVRNANPSEYDALLLPGGVMNPDALRMHTEAVSFVKSFFEAGKPVAAICHGPWTIVECDAARGRRMTSWPSLKTDITNAGGEWVDAEAVVDANLLTSRKPDDLPAFNREMLALFAAHQAKVAAKAT